MLIGNKITSKYNGTQLLSDVSISVPPGKMTILIGPSGGGKTTLVRALSLLDLPDTGTLSIDKKKYTFPLSRKELAENPPWPKVTVVFQQLFLWPHLSLRDNILLSVERENDNVQEVFNEITRLFKMNDFIDQFPNEASLGQRQRAALARAVILNPSYILLDEITSALDVEQTHIILNYLLELRSRGIGLLVVTHALDFARNLLERREGDQIVFMGEGGHILETGGTELLDNPKHPRIREFLRIPSLL